MVSPPVAIAFAVAVIFTLPILLGRVRKLRLVKVGTFWQSILWSLRLSRFKHSFPATLEEWDIRHMPTEDEYLATWELLRPFFASRGYTLYLKKPGSGELFPSTRPAVASHSLRFHPYSRTLDYDEDFSMLTGVSMSVCITNVANKHQVNHIYGARDNLDRDVIIKCSSSVVYCMVH